MDVTPKLLNSVYKLFIVTVVNKTLDINVTVYSNLDVAARVGITFSLKAIAKKRIYLKNRLRNG